MITETHVTKMKAKERYGLLKGLNEQLPMSERSQNDLLHHEIGISCTARIRANGKYEPINMMKPDSNLNCMIINHLCILRDIAGLNA